MSLINLGSGVRGCSEHTLRRAGAQFYARYRQAALYIFQFIGGWGGPTVVRYVENAYQMMNAKALNVGTGEVGAAEHEAWFEEFKQRQRTMFDDFKKEVQDLLEKVQVKAFEDVAEYEDDKRDKGVEDPNEQGAALVEPAVRVEDNLREDVYKEQSLCQTSFEKERRLHRGGVPFALAKEVAEEYAAARAALRTGS